MNKLSVVVLSMFVIVTIFLILVYLTFFLNQDGLKAEPEEMPEIKEKKIYEFPEIPDKTPQPTADKE